jgi:hypothetical protein
MASYVVSPRAICKSCTIMSMATQTSWRVAQMLMMTEYQSPDTVAHKSSLRTAHVAPVALGIIAKSVSVSKCYEIQAHIQCKKRASQEKIPNAMAMMYDRKCR